MKKALKTMVSAAMLFALTQNTQQANAQSSGTTGFWDLKGNTATNSTNFLGTTDNVNLRIKTKNQVRMTVTGGGKVCIGSVIPSFKLDVVGGSINTDSLYRINTVQVLKRDASNRIQIGDNTAKVGIGTATPTATLDVFNSAGVASLFVHSANDTARIIIDRGSTSGSALLEYRTQGGFPVWQTGTTTGLDGDFFINCIGSIDTAMRILKSTGNIGIGGRASNNAKLFVEGATEVTGQLKSAGMEVSGELKVTGGIGLPGPGKVFTSDAAGAGSWQNPQISGGGATKRIAFWKDATSLSSSVNLFWDSTNFRLGIGTSIPAFQLELSTNSAAKPTSSAWTVSSDSRLKKDVSDFNEGLELIRKIHPVWFTYTGEAGMPVNDRGIGTLAQDIQKIAPYMIKDWTYTNEKGEKQNYLGVDYGAMDFILVNAIKEQQSQIDLKNAEIAQQQKDIEDLKTKFASMENALSQCCMNYKSGAGSTEINSDVAKLEQNVPNPFSENTVIKFYVPQNAKNAVIKIYGLDGSELKTIPVPAKGIGQAEISGKTFSAGTYTYMLLVDGKVVDTKQMVLTKK